MAPTQRDVLGIGMAVVDSFVRADDAFLERNGLARGGTTFLDRAALVALMEQALEHYAIRRQQLTQEAEASAATQFPNVEEPEPEREPLPVKPSTKVPREERPSMTRGR